MHDGITLSRTFSDSSCYFHRAFVLEFMILHQFLEMFHDFTLPFSLIHAESLNVLNADIRNLGVL